jgi:hypothetical protein
MFKNFKLSIQHLWAVTAVVGVFIFVSTHPIRPQDFWWHMAVGREIVTTAHIPQADDYSYTMKGQPYPAYKIYWLMEVLMYLVFRAGSGELVVFIHSLVITGAYAILLWLCYKISGSWRIAAFCTLFAAALGLNDWNVRPQAITFMLGAIILLAIFQLRANRRKIWLGAVFLAMVVWVNSHGTYPIGLILLGSWWLDEAWICYHAKGGWKEKLALPTSAIFLGLTACMINPQGIGIVSYVQGMAASPVIQDLVIEWAAPSFESLGGTLFFIGLLFCACVIGVSPKRPTIGQIFIFVVFSLLGLKTMRGVVWFGIVMAPILAYHIQAIFNGHWTHKPVVKENLGSKWLNRIFLILLLLLVIFTLPWFKQALPLPALKAGIYSSETPIGATKFLLKEQLSNPIFNAMSFGSYLIWEAQPDHPVFVDPRIDLFDAATLIKYIMVSNGGENWQNVLDEYGIQTIMVSPTEQAGLIEALNHSASWEKIYSDDAAIIYIRQ